MMIMMSWMSGMSRRRAIVRVDKFARKSLVIIRRGGERLRQVLSESSNEIFRDERRRKLETKSG